MTGLSVRRVRIADWFAKADKVAESHKVRPAQLTGHPPSLRCFVLNRAVAVALAPVAANLGQR